MRGLSVITAVAILAMSASGARADQNPSMTERYYLAGSGKAPAPDATSKSVNTGKYLINMDLKWPNGKTVTVAFNGGDSSLHREIAEIAQEWTKYGNIKLDFGYDQKTGTYRQWHPADTTFAADIRLAFDEPGHFSYIGQDSVNPESASPGSKSMNLGVDLRPAKAAWRHTVLHEFGHALGFEHEHKHPKSGCPTELRWEDDIGYTKTKNQRGEYTADAEGRLPGVYTWFSGEPNNWDRDKVIWNVMPLLRRGAYAVSDRPDLTSVMQYCLDSFCYSAGKASACFCDNWDTGLSPSDRDGIALAYPKTN